MKSLNKSLYEFGKLIEETDLQEAYRELIKYIKELRIYFKENHPEFEVSGNLYQGYMDLTFFSFTTTLVNQRQLKYMVVFRYEKMRFEVWLSGRNRAVMSDYHGKFSKYDLKNYSLTDDVKGMSSIIEAVLVEQPDFDDLSVLTRQIDRGVTDFVKDVENMIVTHG